MKTLNVYLAYDALFDLRYGRFVTKYPELENDLIIKFAHYTNRRSDLLEQMFSNVDDDALAKMPITLEVIKNSPRTTIHKLIQQAFRSFSGEFQDEETLLVVTLDFMRLPIPREAQETYRLLVGSLFDHKVKVKVSNIALTDRTPKYLKSKYQLVIIYDINAQLLMHPPTKKSIYYGIAIYSPFGLLGKEREFARRVKAVRCSYNTADLKNVDDITLVSEFLGAFLEIYLQELIYFSALSPRMVS